MRHAADSFCLLVQVRRDLSVGRSPCGHIWTGAGVVCMDQEQHLAPALAACTEAERHQAMARFAVLRPHLGSVSKVEMATPMGLIYKALFPSISTFETPPRKTAQAGLAALPGTKKRRRNKNLIRARPRIRADL